MAPSRLRSLLCCIVLAFASCTSPTESPTPTSIIISPPSVTLDAVGATTTLTAAVLDQRGGAFAGATVAWATNNPSVASVSSSGTSVTVTAIGRGTATITATSGGASSSAAVVVTPVATTLTIVQGNNQNAPTGATLASPLQVVVRDRLGQPVSGVTVTFTRTTGTGTVSPSTVVTGADGTASANLTLGAGGPTTVVASSPGLPSVTFTATAATGTTRVRINTGENQAAMAGTPVPVRPSIIVLGADGAPIAGLPVTFTVTEGDGTITSPVTTTNASGIATVGSWTLGPEARANTISAMVGGITITGNPVTFTAAGCTGGASSTTFEITLCIRTVMTATQRTAFVNAANRWSRIITSDLAPIPFTIADSVGSLCPMSSDFDMLVDDIIIFANVDAIDGPGSVLGSAGPCFTRTSNGLPITGLMQFDVADLATLESSGTLTAVILHEMGHVLGIGSLWEEFNLVNDKSTDAMPRDTYYSGIGGLAGFNAIGGATYTGGRKVPVENMGGEGTMNSHWRESVLRNELMTGFINAGSNPLSLLSVRSLEDLGYRVNTAAADPFSLTLALRAPGAPEAGVRLENDVHRGPRYSIDAAGSIRRMR